MAAPFMLSMPPQGHPFCPPPLPPQAPYPYPGCGFRPPGPPCAPQPFFQPGYAPFQAKTVYKYVSQNGGPPSQGKAPAPGPPSAPGPFGCGYFGGAPPPYSAMGPQVCFPNTQAPAPMFCPPQPGPSWMYQPPEPAPPRYLPAPGPAPAFHPPPQTYQATGNTFRATGKKAMPRPGARVQGELPIYPGGKPPVLHTPDICTFHFVKSEFGLFNPGRKPGSNYEFDACRMETRATIRQLLEAAGARAEAPHAHEYEIGVTEALEGGNGLFVKGSTFTAHPDDYRSDMTLAEAGWTRDRGEADQNPPVILVFEP